jgi:hypothetical protein
MARRPRLRHHPTHSVELPAAPSQLSREKSRVSSPPNRDSQSGIVAAAARAGSTVNTPSRRFSSETIWLYASSRAPLACRAMPFDLDVPVDQQLQLLELAHELLRQDRVALQAHQHLLHLLDQRGRAAIRFEQALPTRLLELRRFGVQNHRVILLALCLVGLPGRRDHRKGVGTDQRRAVAAEPLSLGIDMRVASLFDTKQRIGHRPGLVEHDHIIPRQDLRLARHERDHHQFRGKAVAHIGFEPQLGMPLGIQAFGCLEHLVSSLFARGRINTP